MSRETRIKNIDRAGVDGREAPAYLGDSMELKAKMKVRFKVFSSPPVHWVDSMLDCMGREFTIQAVNEEGGIFLEGMNWCWSWNDFEKGAIVNV